MNYLIALLALTGLVASNPVSKDLNDDILALYELIDHQAVAALVVSHSQDPEFIRGLVFFRSEEFSEMYLNLHDIAEYQELILFLASQGMDVERYINYMRYRLGLPEFKLPEQNLASRNGGSFHVFLQELLALILNDDVRASIVELNATSPEFANLVDALRSEKFQVVVQTVRAEPAYQTIIVALGEIGIDTDALGESIANILGWN